jgi:hypothetical protein
MTDIKLYPCGAEVVIKTTKLTGIITGQLNRFGYIEYEVSYFADGIRYSIWMHESQFSTGEKKKIGF